MSVLGSYLLSPPILLFTSYYVCDDCRDCYICHIGMLVELLVHATCFIVDVNSMQSIVRGMRCLRVMYFIRKHEITFLMYSIVRRQST